MVGIIFGIANTDLKFEDYSAVDSNPAGVCNYEF